MRRIPAALLWGLAAVTVSVCGGDGKDVLATAGLPFDPQGRADGASFLMVSETADTLWFRAEVAEEEPLARLVRTRRTERGVDSLSARIDRRTHAPVSSHHVLHSSQGVLIATVEYGAGFEGQARIVVQSPSAQLSDNLRTPAPYLDAAQIPQSLSALQFGAPDTVTFAYVAPFENRALNARLLIGPRGTLDLPSGRSAVFPVTLRVSGLEERFWFSAHPPHRLVRWRDVTRGVTWTRVEP